MLCPAWLEWGDERGQRTLLTLLTCLDEIIVGVAPEESVGEEGDYGVDGWHVQYS